jgi:CheY-like chemotaxis protein
MDPEMRVLVIQFWIRDIRVIRSALEVAGITAQITRVDIEPALHAALSWGEYDLAIYDPSTPTISRTAVDDCLRVHGRDIPLVLAEDGAPLVDRIQCALAARRS